MHLSGVHCMWYLRVVGGGHTTVSHVALFDVWYLRVVGGGHTTVSHVTLFDVWYLWVVGDGHTKLLPSLCILHWTLCGKFITDTSSTYVADYKCLRQLWTWVLYYDWCTYCAWDAMVEFVWPVSEAVNQWNWHCLSLAVVGLGKMDWRWRYVSYSLM